MMLLLPWLSVALLQDVPQNNAVFIGLILIVIAAAVIAATTWRTFQGWLAAAIIVLAVLMLLHIGPF